MEYVNLGRKLGRGTRLAAEALRSQAQDAVVAARSKTPEVKTQGRVVVQQGKVVTRRVSSGTRGFTRGFWKPFAHAVRALWHEITGLFFAIFTLFFAGNLWRLRASWLSGPSHNRFILYAVITAIFLYFAVSSFLRVAHHNRAHRKNR